MNKIVIKNQSSATWEECLAKVNELLAEIDNSKPYEDGVCMFGNHLCFVIKRETCFSFRFTDIKEKYLHGRF